MIMTISRPCVGILLLSFAISYPLCGQDRANLPGLHRPSQSLTTGTFGPATDDGAALDRLDSVGDTGFTVLGRWTWGPCLAVEMTGNFALLGQGLNYQVLDVTDLSNPRLLYDTTMEQAVTYIKVVDTLLFVVMSGRVLFCDARQLYPLKEYGRYDKDPMAQIAFREISVSDSLMFITGRMFGMIAVNISDLQNPVFRGGIGLYYFPYNNPIAAKGEYIYYGPQGPGLTLYIFRWTPDSAFGQVWKTVDEVGAAVFLHLRDSLLFVGNGSVFCYSITDPWNPQLLDSVSLGSIVDQMSSRGDNLYCSTRDSGIVVVNIADPTHLSIVDHAPKKTGIASQSAASDAGLGVAEYTGVEFYSIAQADSILRISFFPSGGQYYGIANRGGIMFVASTYAGLWSVDFRDPTHPRPVSNLLTPDYSVDVVVTGAIACVLVKPDRDPTHDSVVVVQVDDVGSLTRLSSFATDLNATSITARDSLIIVGADSAVGIFSIADPVHPKRVSTWRQPGTDLSVSVERNLLAVGARVWDAGLRLIDISDPTSPRELSYVPMDVLAVLLRDTVVYMESGGLRVFSVSDPSQPFQVSYTSSPCNCSSAKIILEDKILYKLGTSVRVIDVADLSAPRELTSLLENSFPFGAVAIHDTLFVATSGSGVWALKNDFVTSVENESAMIPNGFVLYDNYPNPFNPSTSIRYKLPVKSFVTLRVYDLLGQEVTTLVNETKPAGSYEVTWNALNSPSGVYFYRLEADNRMFTKGMLVIR